MAAVWSSTQATAAELPGQGTAVDPHRLDPPIMQGGSLPLDIVEGSLVEGTGVRLALHRGTLARGPAERGHSLESLTARLPNPSEARAPTGRDQVVRVRSPQQGGWPPGLERPRGTGLQGTVGQSLRRTGAGHPRLGPPPPQGPAPPGTVVGSLAPSLRNPRRRQAHCIAAEAQGQAARGTGV
eukprot:Hpha_TRINITY_DN29891_c0_g1::TRINITY_DN29891_c0_g1_i1::g.2858::m.2858